MSLVIGFCKCKKCGWTDGKFNWHTYFVCPECKCREYIKEADPFVKETEEGFNRDSIYGSDDNRSAIRLSSF